MLPSSSFSSQPLVPQGTWPDPTLIHWLRGRALLPGTCHSPGCTGRRGWSPRLTGPRGRGCVYALLSPKGPEPRGQLETAARVSSAHSHLPLPVLSSQIQVKGREQNVWYSRNFPQTSPRVLGATKRSRKCQENGKSGEGAEAKGGLMV